MNDNILANCDVPRKTLSAYYIILLSLILIRYRYNGIMYIIFDDYSNKKDAFTIYGGKLNIGIAR